MTLYGHMETFMGKPVLDWSLENPVIDPAQYIYRLRLDYDEAQNGERWTDLFAEFLSQPNVEQTTGLIVGAWGEMFEDGGEAASVVEALVAAHNQLPNLRALFMGDVISEECEISWMHQTDMSPLFDAYPALEEFGARGADGLRLGTLRHAQLRSLTIESGGLGVETVREIAGADLPTLEHLEVWLGTPDYGGNATIDDLAPILSGARFPALTYLGLRDSAIADEIAVAIANAPILERVKVLDLSLGTLGDEGAQALIASPAVARLEKLDIHHHYCSDEVIAQLEKLGIEVDVSEQEETDEYDGDEYRYVAVGE